MGALDGEKDWTDLLTAQGMIVPSASDPVLVPCQAARSLGKSGSWPAFASQAPTVNAEVRCGSDRLWTRIRGLTVCGFTQSDGEIASI